MDWTNTDCEVAVSMTGFIEKSMKTIDNEVRKCKALMDELDMRKSVIRTLNTKRKDLEVEVVRQQTCRVSKSRWYDGCTIAEIK